MIGFDGRRPMLLDSGGGDYLDVGSAKGVDKGRDWQVCFLISGLIQAPYTLVNMLGPSFHSNTTCDRWQSWREECTPSNLKVDFPFRSSIAVIESAFDLEKPEQKTVSKS